jgi:hypothetical protein
VRFLSFHVLNFFSAIREREEERREEVRGRREISWIR